jgi:hypothetical protein
MAEITGFTVQVESRDIPVISPGFSRSIICRAVGATSASLPFWPSFSRLARCFRLLPSSRFPYSLLPLIEPKPGESMSQRIASTLLVFVAVCALIAAPLRADNETRWMGPSNGLWADPLNWTDGVPTAGSNVSISFPFAGGLIPIDLGGVERSAGILDLFSPYVRLTNGSLVVNSITAQQGYDTLNPPNTIAIPITSIAPVLHLNGASNSVLQVNAPIAGSGLGVQSTYVSFNAANTYTGATTVTAFSRTSFAGQGSALATSSVEVGGTLVIDNREVNLADRLSDAAPIRFDGGALQFLGNASVDGFEHVGTLDFAMFGAINLPAQIATPFTLRAAGIRHDAGAFGQINLGAHPGNRIILDSPPQLLGGGAGAPATARGTIPWLFDTHGLPLTYDAGDPAHPDDAPGLRPLDPATELAPSIPDSPAGFLHNVRIAADQTRTGDADLNFLAVSLATLTLDHSTLTVHGNWLSVDSATIGGNGTLQFPGDATIAGGGHLDVPIRAHSLALMANDVFYLSKANDIPGGTDLGYRVVVGHPQALGTGRVHIQDGSRITFGMGDATLTNDFAFGDLLSAPSPNPGGYAAQSIRLSSGVPSSTVTFKGNLSAGEITVVLSGNYRLDGDASFDSLLLLASGSNRFELNGTLAPARTTPAFIEFRGNLAGNGKLLGAFGDGMIDPGPLGKPGRLTIHEVLRAGLHVDLAGSVAGNDYDQVVILDRVLTLLQLQVNLAADFTPAPGESFLILDNQGILPLTATFYNLPQGAILEAGNSSFQISYIAGDGNDISLTVVPEPAALPVAVLLLLVVRRRRKR